MTDEPGQDRSPPRRKFDDVASLFGTIVPAPGAIPRPATIYPILPAVREWPPKPDPEPEPEPQIEPLATVLAQPAIEPGHEVKIGPRVQRPHPNEVPWPDAFEPRPNFRRREPRNWTWLLLIPVGFVAAVGMITLDPRTVRTWVEINLMQRTPAAAITTAPVPLPPPSPPAAETPVAEFPNPYPAIPTSPVPVPPGMEAAPPPVDAAQTAAAAAAPIRITIQYRRNIPGSDGEARRIAALLQTYGGSIELHPNQATTRVPTINYYNAADKTAATALSTVLASEAVNWTVRLGTTKSPLGTLDVWLP